MTKTGDGLVVTNYTYDANDRLIKDGVITYSYDANGNTLEKIEGMQLTKYRYNYENRLIEAVSPTDTTIYAYDVDGIRVSQMLNGDTTRYLVDKNRDYAQVLEERDVAGVLIVAYAYGDDLISQTRGDNSSYYHYDGLGSTRALTDDMEVTTDTYAYESFGKLIGATGNTINNFLFTGERYDPNVGFYYLRQRYYRPETGRFIVMDSFSGMDNDPPSIHKYIYSENNPPNLKDPSGLTTLQDVSVSLTISSILTSIAMPSFRGWLDDRFGRDSGETDRFELYILWSGTAGLGPYGGFWKAYISERQPSSPPWHDKPRRAAFNVFMYGLGVGGGAAIPTADGASIKFTTATRKNLTAFQGIGRIVTSELGFGYGISSAYITLPDGTKVCEETRCPLLSYGPIALGGASIYTVGAYWDYIEGSEVDLFRP